MPLYFFARFTLQPVFLKEKSRRRRSWWPKLSKRVSVPTAILYQEESIGISWPPVVRKIKGRDCRDRHLTLMSMVIVSRHSLSVRRSIWLKEADTPLFISVYHMNPESPLLFVRELRSFMRLRVYVSLKLMSLLVSPSSLLGKKDDRSLHRHPLFPQVN